MREQRNKWFWRLYVACCTAVLLVFLVCVARSATEGGVYSETIYYRDVSMGSWKGVSNLVITYRIGGAWTNGAYTNYYRMCGTNDLGRLPLSTVVTSIWVGTTNQSNAVTVGWEPRDGVWKYIVERSWDGNAWTQYVEVGPGGTSYTDFATNDYTNAVFTNVFTNLMADPVGPWPPGTSTVTTIIGGTNINVSPTTGVGNVTINHVDTNFYKRNVDLVPTVLVNIGQTNNPYSNVVAYAMLFKEKSVDPPAPLEGFSFMWMSDGTGSGMDGDVLALTTAGGSTRTNTVFSFLGPQLLDVFVNEDDQAVTAAAGWEVVTNFTENGSIGNWTTTHSNIIVGVAGTYKVLLAASIQSDTLNTVLDGHIFTNSTEIVRLGWHMKMIAAGDPVSATGIGSYDFDAGTPVTFRVDSDKDTTLTFRHLSIILEKLPCCVE